MVFPEAEPAPVVSRFREKSAELSATCDGFAKLPCPPAPIRARASFLRSLAAPLLLGLACFIVFNANLRQIGAGDSLSARFLPLLILRDGTLALDGAAHLVARGHGMPWDWTPPQADVRYFESPAYWLVRTHAHRIASMYPVVTPLLVTPLYLPAVKWLDRQGWDPPLVDRVAECMEKLSASLLASLASALMYLVLRREAGRWALPLALAFAFGTNTWMISSQALWQHGTGQLLVALALLLVLAPATPARLALLGSVCALLAANRPPDSLLAGAFALYALWRQRGGWIWLAAGALPWAVALLSYNLHFMGHALGGYALAKASRTAFFTCPGYGWPGLLLSPTRGLLVFSPFLMFVPLGLILRLRAPGTRDLAAVLGCAVIAQISLYSLADWRAGVSWGPRWLTDLLPILVWMLAPAPAALRPAMRWLFIATVAASVAVQAIGAFWYTEASDERIFANDPSSMRAAWDLRNVPFLVELGHPPARAELLEDARGSLDLVGSTPVHGRADVLNVEDGTVLAGWALAGGRTPAQVLVLIDGIVAGSTEVFGAREDVSQALRTTAPSGWQVAVNTRGIRAGARVLQLAVRISPRSDIRIIRDQPVLVAAPRPAASPLSESDLDALAGRASARLRERQAREGYWLTRHTRDIQYAASQPEMNTFLTSMLVDLLAPAAGRHGLDDALARARDHLRAQIEPNGLVRYHGLPDGPGIGTLGCAISPDADDTALVWRIAGPGPDDPRRPRMLRELARYRDASGLYRTWLAPRDEYQGIDPGRDPNPADLTIQMHVYLMLRELDPPAAEQLGQAIQRAFGAAEVWVYYDQAPLVPYLRAAELCRLGCPVGLPADRLARAAAGQEVWSEAARLLVDVARSPDEAGPRQAIRHVLARLGRDDFAALRQAPPLLYHNDLSASVRRFYWSEDFGYALWLRLHDAAGAGTGTSR